MGTEIHSVNPYMKNAYSSKAKFDMDQRNGTWVDPFDKSQDMDGDLEINLKKLPPKTWELDVKPLISSKKWLQNYGLKKNKLDIHHILPKIGFKLQDDYNTSIKRPISSRYGCGLFTLLLRPDGKTFNITGSKEKLHQIKKRLVQAVNLYRRRLEWLTTESRRIFGVIEEKAVTIVLDIKNMSPQQFDQCRTALESVIREQVSQLAKFNLIRASEDTQMYNPECVPVTHDTIENAIQWMWDLDRLAAVSNTGTCEAVLRALSDKNNEAVYLFTEGSSVDTSRELLKEKIVACDLKLPIHAISYNCESSDTIRFLKDFTRVTGGRFHAYAVVMEMDAYEAQPVDPLTNKANIVLKRKTYGGLPPGVGIREDIVLMFEELEEARNVLGQIMSLIEQAPEPNVTTGTRIEKSGEEKDKDEQYMSSWEWLQKYGMEPQKLGLYDVLSGVAFKHQDGVIDLMNPPQENKHTNAVSHSKLINARYCDQFPVVRWKDGRVVHVQVTPEVHRSYEQRMNVAVNRIQHRVDWLNQGSRALFGTLIEDQVYILIDTSASMQPSIQFVKDKLFVLMQEQLRHKTKFNLVSFNSKAVSWRDRMVEINERNLQSAWAWVQGLSCWGSTNTYGAIQIAMADPHTQAMYILTDGRPDQPPKSVLAQVQMQNRVPIHSISFNCNDTEANRFLFELARTTGGRYHHYSESGIDMDQPEAFESEDIRLLKQEMKRGLENLDQLGKLRDECATMSWRREIDSLKKCSKDHLLSDTDRSSAIPPLETKELYRPSSPLPSRPRSAPPSSARHSPVPPANTSSSMGVRSSTSLRRSISGQHQLTRVPKKPLVANHTRTSLLRTLNSSGRFSPNEWLLPETKQLFQKQADRQQKLQEVLEELELSPHLQQHENERKEKFQIRRKKKILHASQVSSKQWLAKNNLIAKRLTILDALAPTLVPHKAKFVPILDKHVMARVFDEILPIAHVSSRKKKQIKLVNPNGVNLKKYEEKLEKAIDSYKMRLDSIVWDVLPDSVKEQYDNDGPVSFLDNREDLLNALEDADWPIREQDIMLLAEEIAKGEKFLQQSKDLRKAADPSQGDDLDVYDDHASIVSGLTGDSIKQSEVSCT